MGRSHSLLLMLQSLILMHFEFLCAPQGFTSSILFLYGIIAAFASFKAHECVHQTLYQVGYLTNNFMSIVFFSRVSLIMRRQLLITWVNLTSLLQCVTKYMSFQIASLLFYFTIRVILPLAMSGLVFS